MEYSKEYFIQLFLKENNFEHVKLNTIKTITCLYKVLKKKRNKPSNKNLFQHFKDFINVNFTENFQVNKVKDSKTKLDNLPTRSTPNNKYQKQKNKSS